MIYEQKNLFYVYLGACLPIIYLFTYSLLNGYEHGWY